MNTSAYDQTPTVTLTEVAAGRIARIIAAEKTEGLMLRMSVKGGGCSGFSYGFDLDTERSPDDLLVERDGVTLLVDPISLQYLGGAEVDYQERLEGASFIIRNPNAKTSCGCGSSFSA